MNLKFALTHYKNGLYCIGYVNETLFAQHDDLMLEDIFNYFKSKPNYQGKTLICHTEIIEDKDLTYCEHFYVSKTFRNKGFGTQMADFIEKTLALTLSDPPRKTAEGYDFWLNREQKKHHKTPIKP